MQGARGTSLTDEPLAPDSPEPSPAHRRRAVGVLAAVALVVLALDVVSKIIVVAELSDRAPIELLGGALELTETRNPGAAFSIGTSATWVFTIVATGVVAVILYSARRLGSVWWAVALGLLLGGASGNLADRVFRSPGVLRGHVVDWIDFQVWPVFNLADSAIVGGGVLAVLLSMRGLTLAGHREPDRDQPKP